MSQPLPKNELYTYEDYASWPGDVRCELIEGRVYMMASPSIAHQRMVSEFHVRLKNYLRGKRCEAFISPTDVMLKKKNDRDTVVQPDVFVVCDKNKITQKNIQGAPDLVIEVLSPSNAAHDLSLKRSAYERNGVREFWAIDLENKNIITHVLEDGYYESEIRGEGELRSSILEGFILDIAELFGAVELETE